MNVTLTFRPGAIMPTEGTVFGCYCLVAVNAETGPHRHYQLALPVFQYEQDGIEFRGFAPVYDDATGASEFIPQERVHAWAAVPPPSTLPDWGPRPVAANPPEPTKPRGNGKVIDLHPEPLEINTRGSKVKSHE